MRQKPVTAQRVYMGQMVAIETIAHFKRIKSAIAGVFIAYIATKYIVKMPVLWQF
jgi:hypothetical protein